MDDLALRWSGQETHSLLVHLPVVLLLSAPWLALPALLRTEGRRRLLVSTLIVMMLGTASLYVARHTGGLALQEHQPAVESRAPVAQHRALAAEAAAVFTLGTALLGLILLLTLRFRLRWFELDAVLPVALLVFYALGVLLLVRTLYRGGDLVHEFGI